MSETEDLLQQLLAELRDEANIDQNLPPEERTRIKTARDRYLNAMLSKEAIRKHVIERIEARDFVLTGDEGHASVEFYLKQAAAIDQPKKYEWQEDGYAEKEFIRSIGYLLPGALSFGDSPDVEDTLRAIAGEGSITVLGDRESKCYDCTAPLRLTISGNKFHMDCERECENNRVFSVEVDFPTGEVVFADWPDRFSEIKDAGYLDECDGESINYIRGQRLRSEGFARQGIYHHSVGNTCPSWYYNEATGQINIGGGTYNEDTDETTIPEGFKDMGSFCTDLWWVTMLDKSRYDEMVSKLPKTRNTKYYDKDVETATIKPGRYRFTSVPRDRMEDDASELFATAEYIGPCGDVPPVKYITEDKVILTPRQHLLIQAHTYPTLFGGQAERMRLRAADQIFNVLGNGIRSKGEFLSYISAEPDIEIPDALPPDGAESPKGMTAKDYVFRPYPNFDAKYSTINVVGVKNIPTEWLEEAEWFYGECQKFFNGEHVHLYSNAFPAATQAETDKRLKQVQDVIDRHLAEGETQEQVKAWLKANYRMDYDGDLHATISAKWEAERAEIKKFITKTLKSIRTELTKRK